ncbi:MAG: bacterial Ig-like domain-containing protein, partial [Firmicutes bacterium]|nr:bacterial Ig-like domain-containing protein [Bacillota bacterium]
MGSIGKNFSVTETSDGATLAVTAQNKGKLSNGDDSYAYYAYQVPLANDFSMSATITVNNYNTLFAGTTNTNQSSFGIVGFDEIYSGSNNTSNQLFLMAYAEKSSSSAAEMVAAKRHKGDSEKTILGSMSDSFGIKSAGGPFKVSIVKAGTNYVIKCDDKEVTVSDPDLFTADPYFGFFVARDASITVSDLQFSVDEKTVRDIKVVTPPAKTTYKIGEKVDLTGAEIEVTYTDGSTEIVDNNNVVVSDFDSSSKGARTMYVNKGVVSAPIDYTIVSDGVVSINLLSEPYINEYSVDMYFSTDGISAEAVIDTGEVIEMIYEGDYKEESASESDKRAPKYAFYLDGEKVDDTYIISEKNVGDKQVEVRAISSDSIEANDVKATYDVTITPERLTSLGIIAKPINVEFFTGQTFDYSGLIVKGIYTDAQGNTKESRLKEKDYIVEAPSLATAGTKTVNIVSAQNSSVKTSYDIDVFEKNFIEYTIKEYPIMTVQQGEAFDPKGLVVGAYFISGEVDAIPEDQYTLDLSQFDSSAVGKTTVNVVVNGTYGQATLPLEITVREKSEQIWKSAAFGQSTSTSSEKVTLNDDGSVTVYAAADSGKITADHDGIAYYYPRVPAEDNFTISGTVKVDYYLKNNDDTGRSGQEAFGIMLRDAIPLVDKNVDLSGAKNLSQQIDIMKQYDAVADMNDALIGEDGEPVV